MSRVRRTILVVDREPAVQGLIRLLLVGAGYRVLQAHGPEDALDVLRGSSSPIDLVLADVELPDQGCYTITQHVLHESPVTRVLCMSALPEDEEAQRRREAEVVPKPLDAVELVRRIREALATGGHPEQ
jgi:DNA-binding response OmpR family regulator